MKTYREHIYEICSSVDLENKDEVTRVLQYLAKEAVMNQDVCMRHEEKLKELMSYKDFTEMSTEIAKEMFRQDVEAMPEGDFKNFVIDNLEGILGEEEKGDENGHDDVRG